MTDAPSHAVTLWTSGDSLHVAFQTPKGHTQTISLPATPNGLSRLHALLRERAMTAASSERPSFASPAIPIQAMIDGLKITTVVKVTERPTRSGPARRFTATSETELEILADALEEIF
jgi:hypothetical protein